MRYRHAPGGVSPLVLAAALALGAALLLPSLSLGGERPHGSAPAACPPARAAPR